MNVDSFPQAVRAAQVREQVRGVRAGHPLQVVPRAVQVVAEGAQRLELHLCCVAQAKRCASGLRGIELQIRPG